MMPFAMSFRLLLTGLALTLAGAAKAATETVSAAGITEGADPLAPAMIPAMQPLVGWLVALPIILPIFGAAITLTLRSRRDLQAPLAVILMSGTVVSAILLNTSVMADGPMLMAMGNWLPPFAIVITVDALGSLLVLTTSVIGLIGLSYTRRDVDGEATRYGFYSFYLLMIGGVNGAFSTGDIFNLYVWFEVFLVSSFGLMILGGTRIQLDAAVKYGVLNLIATTVFLIAIGVLYGLTGSLNMADLRVALTDQPAAPLATIGALFVLAFAMKAAAFPLHFWLPASYHTPKVIVSALFAGLLTKVGIYCLMRIMIMLFGSSGAGFLPLLLVLGVLTAVIGAMGALAQTDMKRMAAFLVVSGIGVMLIGLGLGTQSGLAGALVYAVHSMLVMTALFLILGVCESLAGTGNLSAPGGLYSVRAFVAGLFLVFGFAAAGLPPFSGFWPKLMLIDASFAKGGGLAILGAVGVILSGFLTTIVIGRAWALMFLKPAPEGAPVVRSDRTDISLTILAILVIGIGLFPSTVIDIASRGAAGLLDPTLYVQRVLGGS